MKNTTHIQNASISRYIAPGSISKITPMHYGQIEEWYKARGKEMPQKGLLSDIGYIVDGRVAGWLYLTNSNMCFIENIISDPNTVPSLRRASVRKLIGFFIDISLAMGYSSIFGLTQHPGIMKVSEEFGFKEVEGFKLVVLHDNE